MFKKSVTKLVLLSGLADEERVQLAGLKIILIKWADIPSSNGHLAHIHQEEPLFCAIKLCLPILCNYLFTNCPWSTFPQDWGGKVKKIDLSLYNTLLKQTMTILNKRNHHCLLGWRVGDMRNFKTFWNLRLNFPIRNLNSLKTVIPSH